jgi:hypothetical protein
MEEKQIDNKVKEIKVIITNNDGTTHEFSGQNGIFAVANLMDIPGTNDKEQKIDGGICGTFMPVELYNLRQSINDKVDEAQAAMAFELLKKAIAGGVSEQEAPLNEE